MVSEVSNPGPGMLIAAPMIDSLDQAPANSHGKPAMAAQPTNIVAKVTLMYLRRFP